MEQIEYRELTPTFDYSQLDAETATFVQTKKQAMQKRTVLSLVADGRDLRAVKEKLGDKLFQEWVHTEYWFTYRTALKRIHVADMMDANGRDEIGSSQQFDNKTISELYELAAAYRRPQIAAPEDEEDADQQEVQGILGEYDLEMSDEAVGTDIDVAAMVAENQQQKAAIQTLEAQLQQALQQDNGAVAAPTRHYGGGYHAPSPTVQDNGVKHVWSHATQSRKIIEVVREIGAGKGGFDTSVSEDVGNHNYFYGDLGFSSPKLDVSLKLEKYSIWVDYVAGKLEELAKEIRKYSR